MWDELIIRFLLLYMEERKKESKKLKRGKLQESIFLFYFSDWTRANVEIHRSDRSLSHSIAPDRQIPLSDSEGLLCMKAPDDYSAPVPTPW